MFDRWRWIINNAVLNVVSSDIHVHGDDFHTFNRLYPFHVMSYIKEGYAEATVGDNLYPHKSGQLLLIPPQVRHDHYIPNSGVKTTFLWWHFTLTIGGAVDILRFLNPSAVIDVSNAIGFETAFTQYMVLERHSTSVPSIIMKRAKGLEVIAYLMESLLENHQDQSRVLSRIPDTFFEIFKRIVDKPEEQISLSDMSKQYFMNATYISNRFKELFGITPIKLKHDLLTERAKGLILSNNYPLSEIARELGFPNQSSFCRFFTTNAGLPPGRYRQSQLSGD